jgi:hypothetical protein
VPSLFLLVVSLILLYLQLLTPSRSLFRPAPHEVSVCSPHQRAERPIIFCS